LPADDDTNVPVETVVSGENLIATFNENIQEGSGNILLRQQSDDAIISTFALSDFNKVAIFDNFLYLTLDVSLSAGVGYYVEIPDGAILDQAETPNAFAGTGTTGWNFTVASPPSNPTVVINKYLNGAPDMIELLVLGDETPGNTLDMSGMIVKDFSGSMGGDGGGRFTFKTTSLFSSVPVGTLIVLTNSATSSDVDPSGDFVIRVGLLDTTYFEAPSGSFDIATTEMVMIKEAGSDPNGSTGGIHALAAGSPAGSFFINFSGAKVIASETTGANLGVSITNTSSSIVDYVSGTDAIGSLSLLPSSFGQGNSPSNSSYLATLRGLTPGDGDGFAVVLNATPSDHFENIAMFDKGATGQSASVVIEATIPGVTITKVDVTVPSELGVPTVGSVSLSGSGAAGAGFMISGQVISVTSAAVNTADQLVVTVSGLSMPTPTLVTDNGNYPFEVATATASGTPTAIPVNPAAHVIIPIASLRDVNASGISLDSGTTVAVEGVITEEDFGAGGASYSSFIQDGAYGINLFSSVDDPGFVRGSRYAVVGTVTQYNGLTEIDIAASSNIVLIGADTEPAPVVVTIADLLASPEQYEGSLVTVKNLTRRATETDPWAVPSTITMADPSLAFIDVRIQAGSDASTEPSYPSDITGVLGQFDSSSPYTSGYQIMPRDGNDFTASVSGFATWAATNNVTQGASGDDDNDGITNLMEYALGLNPQTPNGSPGSFDGVDLIFTKGSEAVANGDVTYAIEESDDLGALDPWEVVTPTFNGPGTIEYSLPQGASAKFARLVVTQN